MSTGVRVENLSMRFPSSIGGRQLFENLNFSLDRNSRLALLGRNGQGKSTLIKLLGGVIPPTKGRIVWSMTPSWPIGFGGGFQGSLSGQDNVRFLSRIYNVEFAKALDRVESFAELGVALKQPVKHYSSGMRARLAFGLSLAFEFDCYMIDEVVAVGDARFQQKCREELFNRRSDRAFIMATHDDSLVRESCESTSA
jgi:capsular polysaccharide transport system ATP-binding protein